MCTGVTGKLWRPSDDRLWIRIVERLLSQRDAYWSQAKSVRLFQIATTGKERSITNESLLPAWALRLRDLPCLPDTRGLRCKPGDLLRRTPETEALLDVEPFVQARLDTEKTRPLLDVLGVRSNPTGPSRLLDCLRALAKAEKPPVYEVDKWYRRLDQMVRHLLDHGFQEDQTDILGREADSGRGWWLGDRCRGISDVRRTGRARNRRRSFVG